MKKLINLLFIALLLTCLVGCGQEEQATVWSDQLKSKGKIVVGISPDYPPFENINTDGEIEGFDVDMFKTLVSYLDEEYEIEFASITFDNIVTAVQMGQVDLGISGFTYDPDRDVIFSTPYLQSSQVVLVKKDSNITTISDLKGKTIGAQSGTTSYQCASKIEATKEVISFADATIGLQSVKEGNIDAFVADYGVAKNYALANDMIILDEYLTDENMSIIIKNGNTLLETKINELIEKFVNSTDYDELKNKWGL